MNQLTRIRFVILFSFVLEMFLNRLLDLDQAFEVVLQRLEPLMGDDCHAEKIPGT
ncbi:MAG TPA: hypothetical protein PLG83_00710 [Nitrosomonas sp.]|nr:hypothetical protein [Nitrosomonas sp.]